MLSQSRYNIYDSYSTAQINCVCVCQSGTTLTLISRKLFLRLSVSSKLRDDNGLGSAEQFLLLGALIFFFF